MKRRRGTAFVPRVVFGTVFAGVVPACSRHSPNQVVVLAMQAFQDAGSGIPQGTIVLAVQAFDAGPPPTAPDAGVPNELPPGTIVLAVQAFHVDAGAHPTVPHDAGPAGHTGRGRVRRPPMLSVAAPAFGRPQKR